MSISLIPDSAPFNTEQKAWLNGFFSGLMSMTEQGFTTGAGDAAVGLLDAPAEEQEEDFPWHDPALPIDERLAMAEEKPPKRILMAAMAQLDCGSCGYLCQSYSEAIADGSEKNLTLCTPGGTETAKALKKIVKLQFNKDGGASNGVVSDVAAKVSAAAAAGPGTRDNPVVAKFMLADRLNRDGSAKDTRHVAIDLKQTGLKYKVGDALGVYPFNCSDLVNSVATAAKLSLDTAVTVKAETKPFSEALRDDLCLRMLTEELVECAITNCDDAATKAKLQELVDGDDIDEWDVLEFFDAFPIASISAQQMTDKLSPLRPRLYSIASSQSKHAEEVHLTIGRVERDVRGRGRKGVASTMFADRMDAGLPLRVFIHPSHGFSVPPDPAAPMIMVGPGTGIAPFMAFLQQREADKASGKNWLFFGDQKQQFDFLYEDQLNGWVQNGLLNRLDLAFSRDGADKVYVQSRMIQYGADLFAWLEQGGYFFVCGDASRMAVDVDKALQEVIATHGKLSAPAAKEYVAKMTKDKRYVRDVY